MAAMSLHVNKVRKFYLNKRADIAHYIDIVYSKLYALCNTVEHTHMACSQNFDYCYTNPKIMKYKPLISSLCMNALR